MQILKSPCMIVVIFDLSILGHVLLFLYISKQIFRFSKIRISRKVVIMCNLQHIFYVMSLVLFDEFCVFITIRINCRQNNLCDNKLTRN